MKKNRKLWIVLAALVAVVLVAVLCLLLPRLQVEPGVPKSGAIVRQEAAEDGRQLFVLERDMEHMSLQEIMNESDLVVMGFLLEQSPGFQVKSTDGEVSTFTNYFFQVTDTYRGEAPGDVITLREEGGTVEQVKTVVADSYDFAEQQAYLLFLQRPRAGDTFATQGDYYTLVGGAEGVYPIGYLPISLRSDYSLPMYNSQDQGTMMEDAMLAAIQQTNQQTPVAQGEAPKRYATLLGEEPVFSGEPELLPPLDEITGSTVFSSYAAITTFELERDSNLIAVCTYKEDSHGFQVEATNGGVKTFTDYYFQVEEVLRGQAPEDGILTLRQDGGRVGDDLLNDTHRHTFQKEALYLLFLRKPTTGGGFNTQGEHYYLTHTLDGVYPMGNDVLYTSGMDMSVASRPKRNGLLPAKAAGGLGEHQPAVPRRSGLRPPAKPGEHGGERPHGHDDPGGAGRDPGAVQAVRHLCDRPARGVQRQRRITTRHREGPRQRRGLLSRLRQLLPCVIQGGADDLVHIVIAVAAQPAAKAHLRPGLGQLLVPGQQRLVFPVVDRVVGLLPGLPGGGVLPGDDGLLLLAKGEVLVLDNAGIGHLPGGVVAPLALPW